MPFNTGVIVYVALLAAAIIWGIYESYNEKSRTRMNLSFLLTIAMLGIPFYGHGASAVIIGILVLGVLAAYLFASKLNEKIRMSARTMNTALLCTMMIMVGYSSYALIVIRSVANTPMDQNSWKTSSRWVSIWDANSTEPVRCSTDRPTPRKWPSMWKTAIAYPARKVQTPNTSVKRKPHPTKKTLTLNCRDVWNMNTRKTCSSPHVQLGTHRLL